MWTTKKYLCVLLLLPLLLLQPSACTASSPISSPDMVPKETVIRILDDWSESNTKLLKLLSESDSDLKAASEELMTLKKQLAELRIELTAAQRDNKKSRESLERANAELKNIAEDLKALEKKKSRAENQRAFWEVIACLAVGFAVAK